MTDKETPGGQDPHDVLAAEEFAVPAPDPNLHKEPAHDVLAAEEFGVPAPDPKLHHGPLVLPDDPKGHEPPRDVLAAEEFAVPAPSVEATVTAGRAGADSGDQPHDWSRRVAIGVGALLLLGGGLAKLRWRPRRSD
jgi:hypothetical protein